MNAAVIMRCILRALVDMLSEIMCTEILSEQHMIRAEDIYNLKTATNLVAVLSEVIVHVFKIPIMLFLNHIRYREGFWGFGEIGRASCRERVYTSV
jgi:hypothetical protein